MWTAIQYVTSGITLLAFALAVSAWIYRSRLAQRQAILKDLPEADRAKAVDSELEFFRVNIEGLTRKDRFEVAMAQIHARERRFNAIAVVVTIIAALLAAVSVYSIGHSPTTSASTTTLPPPPAQSAPASLPAVPLFDVRASALGRRVTQSTTSEPFNKPGNSIDVGCEEGKSTSVTYDIPAGASVASHNAKWDAQNNIKSHEAHSEIRGSTVVASGSITGLDKQVFNCPGGGHATLVVYGTLNRTTEASSPVAPVAIGTSELTRDPITFTAPEVADLRIESFRVEIRPRGTNGAFSPVDVPASETGNRQLEQTHFGTRFRLSSTARSVSIVAANN